MTVTCVGSLHCCTKGCRYVVADLHVGWTIPFDSWWGTTWLFLDSATTQKIWHRGTGLVGTTKHASAPLIMTHNSGWCALRLWAFGLGLTTRLGASGLISVKSVTRQWRFASLMEEIRGQKVPNRSLWRSGVTSCTTMPWGWKYHIIFRWELVHHNWATQ